MAAQQYYRTGLDDRRPLASTPTGRALTRVSAEIRGSARDGSGNAPLRPIGAPTAMKILVPVKRVVDYNVKIRVKSDGSGVELANVKMSMNPFDEIAVEEALRQKEAGKASEVVVVSIGPAQAAETLRTALAMGADRGILIKTEGLVEPLAVAKLLKGVIAAEQPGLVILGKQAIDDDCNQTGQMLAALTGWAQGTFASKVVIGDGQVDVTREVDGGMQTVDAETAGDRDHRSAPQRAALRLAAQHHEGEEEADRREDAGRFRRRRRARA